ncbi:alpha/beta hydrolase family protein [Glutamicibacter endophyticus]|uniref:alpha/beta hydrolase family protein n=1 Tax=Glutamicibacter endophyticus TaxID=1522174 RepID=UPI003AEF76E7
MPRNLAQTLEPRKTIPATLIGAGAGLAAGSLLAASVSALAGYFARRVVTPDEKRIFSVIVRDIVVDAHGQRWMHLQRTEETTAAGACSFLGEGDACAVRLGPPQPVPGKPRLVARAVEEIYRGSLENVRRGNFSGAIYEHPRDIGIDAHEVKVPLEVGPAPAWLIDGTSHKDTWVICVHGRGARRTESIRALPTLQRVGVSALLISYRNDGLAPATLDGRYGLGDTEWLDVQSAIGYALEHGARKVILMGWSMGGAISLQTADRSALANVIDALVLVGPVINWVDVLSHQARANKIPQSVGRLAQWLLSNPAGRWFTGLAAPVNLKALNWVDRAEELTHRTLIMHSDDDDFVPSGPSHKLATLRPDLVTLKSFRGAGHTREPNVDPQGFAAALEVFLRSRLA